MESVPLYINVATAVVVFMFTMVVIPLARQVMADLRSTIEELKKGISSLKQEFDEHAESDANQHDKLKDRLHELEVLAAGLGAKVEIVGEVNQRLDKLTEKVDALSNQVAGLTASMRSSSRSASLRPSEPRPR